jgi:hypothetical protein
LQKCYCASSAAIGFSNGRLALEIIPIEGRNRRIKMTRLNVAVLYRFKGIRDALTAVIDSNLIILF